jgi:ribosome-binding factor A
MTASKRMVRVDELLRREIGLLCEKLVAPQTQALVTVTKVQCAPDLRDALVFVSVLGSEAQRTDAMRLANQARREFQRELGQRIVLKYTPRLHFREDRSAEHADRVMAILEELEMPAEQSTAAPTADPRPE